MPLLSDDGRLQLARELLRATRVRSVVIGRYSLRDLEILDADVACANRNNVAEITDATRLVTRTIERTLSPPFVPMRNATADVSLMIEDQGRACICWLTSEECLVGLRRDAREVTPFVALVRPADFEAFPRWQHDVARIALLYEQDRDAWARRRNGPAPAEPAEAEIFQHMAIAIAVVDAGRRVVYANRMGRDWLGEKRGLRVNEGRLTAYSGGYRARFCAAVQAATREDTPVPSVLIRQGADGDTAPEIVTCAPIASMPGNALLILGEKHFDDRIAELVLDAFGLTCAERRLASKLLQGRTLDEAARETNIKVSTARSYLKQIFAKTGVRRQGEFVAVVGGMVAPLRASSEPNAVSDEIGRRARWI